MGEQGRDEEESGGTMISKGWGQGRKKRMIPSFLAWIIRWMLVPINGGRESSLMKSYGWWEMRNHDFVLGNVELKVSRMPAFCSTHQELVKSRYLSMSACGSGRNLGCDMWSVGRWQLES